MSVISLQLIQSPPATPDGLTRAKTSAAVTDSAAALQTFVLDGTESPKGFIPSITVAPGAGSYVLTDLDASGNTIGTPVSGTYTTGSVVGTELRTTGATITTVTP